uniref:Uncharacterized protein n=1 Tax=Anguilla anguilla TaxID=7936 RepID=A0A0E9QHI2_ANGAN
MVIGGYLYAVWLHLLAPCA